LQVFRGLFSSELLRPGGWISVGSLTVLFTDIRDPTSFYREIGDAAAFGRVLNHFEVLREAIARVDGALVKTIGDAVTAAFHRPVSALRRSSTPRDDWPRHPTELLPFSSKLGCTTVPASRSR
jgi:class 3 adenylate cyclase